MPDGYLKQIAGHSRSMDTYGVYVREMTDQMELSVTQINDFFIKTTTLKEK